MTYFPYVWGTVPAAKPAGKRGAILLWHFVLLPSLASRNEWWGKIFLEAFDPFVSCWFPAQSLFSQALPFLNINVTLHHATFPCVLESQLWSSYWSANLVPVHQRAAVWGFGRHSFAWHALAILNSFCTKWQSCLEVWHDQGPLYLLLCLAIWCQESSADIEDGTNSCPVYIVQVSESYRRALSIQVTSILFLVFIVMWTACCSMLSWWVCHWKAIATFPILIPISSSKHVIEVMVDPR